MKNVFLASGLVAVVALAGLGIYQRQQLNLCRAELAAAQAQLAVARDELGQAAEAVDKAAYAEKEAGLLQETLTDMSALAAEKIRDAAQLQESLDQVKTNDGTREFAAMFKDPHMREMIRSQQKAVMGPLLEKQYAALFQELQLPPDQAARLKELLQDQMLAASDIGMSMMDPDLDAAGRAELSAKMKEQIAAFDQEIKQVLGEDDYSKYKDYEKGTADRFVLSQFNDQFTGTDTALTAAQEQQLLQAMRQERDNFKWATDLQGMNSGDANFAALLTDERTNLLLEETERLHGQILARAEQMLSPAQFAAFSKHLETQRALQGASMKMARKMFGNDR